MKLTPSKLKKAAQVCDYYAAQRVTLESACEAGGVPYRTFRRWVQEVADVAAMYEKAQAEQAQIYKDQLRLKVPNAFEKLIEGYETEETHTEVAPAKKDGEKPIVLSVRKVKKRIGPNPAAVIFAMKNIYGAAFADSPAAIVNNQNTVLNQPQAAAHGAPGDAQKGLSEAECERLAGIQARMMEIAQARGYRPADGQETAKEEAEEAAPDGR